MSESISKREYFPMFIPSSDKTVLLVGAGVIATRRVKALLEFSFKVKVVAIECSEDIRAMLKAGKLEYIERAFEEKDLIGADIVISATDNREINCKVGKICREQGIPVSVADNKEECTFYFPGIVTSEDIVIGVTSEGKSHKLVLDTVKRLKKELCCED